MTRPGIIVLSGPTASGKSDLALSLAKVFPVEIVNADSLQVYRYLDIGSAKVPREERAGVPHHLIDVVDPDEPYNAGRYVADADRTVAEIVSRGRVPLVVGGTGMYLRSLLRGLDPVPADPAVRAALDRRWEVEGGGSLHAELAGIDPETAARVHPADRLRVVRALEIARIGGVPAGKARTAWTAAGERYRSLFLALWPDREALYRRIDARAEGMFRAGLLEEVRNLLRRGYGRQLKPLGGLGYRQAIAHLLDGIPLPEAVESTKRDTRRYAKRQLTWLAAEPGLERIVPEGAFREAVRKVNMFLS
ncbi:MAG: tRNA (adenosine(37)-N6)-dimethylallyltransferase MiaA [Deltaproteobacteria bacterium]|nr:tRNA (adenosine(37)-N6)-dimethylallyltransferase MiaA [Deltaproteobacteria bacterium]